MKSSSRVSFWNAVTRSFWINLALSGIAGFLAYEAIVVVRQAAVARRELEKQDQKIRELREAKALLEATLIQLKTPEGVEREGKKRLNLKNPGEEVVVVVPEEKSENVIPPSLPWWQKMRNWLRRLYGS